MKKRNRMMRLATAVLMLTILTTGIVGGTFAKYTTQASANDSARVAKFGVTIETDGDLFGETYKEYDATNTDTSNTVTTDTTGITVKSSEASKAVVAPGTKGSETFKISGTSEVAVALDISVGDSFAEVTLPATSSDGYRDYTSSKDTDTFTVSSEYKPIKYSISATGTALNNDSCRGTDLTLEELKTKINSINNALQSSDPATDLATTIGNITISWEWPIGSDDDTNKKDTYLGSIDSTTKPSGVVTDPDFNFTVTVSQVD